MPLTFDRSPELGLALVAEADLSGACYVELAAAPADRGTTHLPYLRQMHAVANGVAEGMVVRPRMPFVPTQWEGLR